MVEFGVTCIALLLDTIGTEVIRRQARVGYGGSLNPSGDCGLFEDHIYWIVQEDVKNHSSHACITSNYPAEYPSMPLNSPMPS